MLQTILLLVLQNVVPVLLEKLVEDVKKPAVTKGMIGDFEVKVGVSEAKRLKRAAKRAKKYRNR